MANIRLTGLYDQKLSEFGARGTGSARFDQDFVNAVNSAIDEINNDTDRSSPISHVQGTDQTITLDETHTEAMSSGISKHLIILGRRPPKGAETLLKATDDAFERGKFRIWSKIVNDEQNADTDDDTTDIIGLGALG